MKNDVEVTVSCHRNNHDEINLEVTCNKSNARFLSIRFTPEEFGMLVTGGSGLDDLTARVAGLDKVGKTRTSEKRTLVVDEAKGIPYSQKDDYYGGLIREHFKDDPVWLPSTYLGARGAVKSLEGGKVQLIFTVHRYD